MPALRDQREFDDLQLGPVQPDDDWVAGDFEVGEHRPMTALRSDPHQRKWMLLGAGGCGLLTAVAVLFMNHESEPTRAAQQAAVEPAPVEQVEPVEPPAPIEPAPAVTEKPKPREKPTLAATSRAATHSGPIKKAPPVPAVVKPASPPPSPAAEPPAKPAEPAPTPAAKPVPPVEPAPADAPASELPDVEAWDEVDAAVEQEIAG